MRTLLSAVSLVGAMGLSSVSPGIEFEFYKLTSAHAPNPGNELYPNQPGPTAISNDWVGNPNLSYTVDGVTVTASATYNGNPAVAMQDRESPWSATRGALWHGDPRFARLETAAGYGVSSLRGE